MKYATMVGNICLDKNHPFHSGKGTPITFEVWKVYNGSQFPGANARDRRISPSFDSLEMAVKELQRKFELEMSERNYEFRIEGESTGYADNEGTPEYFTGESGWYDLNNPSDGTDYPESDYPSDWREWWTKKQFGYSYDNYSVCIVTSAGNLVH